MMGADDTTGYIVHIIENRSLEYRQLMSLMAESGVNMAESCAGNGVCGKCRVRIISGDCTAAGPEEMARLLPEDRERGVRLACFCYVRGPVTIGVADDFCRVSSTPVLTESFTSRIRANRGQGIDPWESTGAGNPVQGSVCGVAVDIGTTTVAAVLYNLNNGYRLAVASALNPQTRYGLDVLSRIRYAGAGSVVPAAFSAWGDHNSSDGGGMVIASQPANDARTGRSSRAEDLQCEFLGVLHSPADSPGRPLLGGLGQLQGAIRDCLNKLIYEMVHTSGVDAHSISSICVAGNPVMLHILLGVDPAPIGRSPYEPVFREAVSLTASSLGLYAAPSASIYCLPAVSGYIGADIVGGIVAAGLHRTDEPWFFMDLGTNCEMVLFSKGRLWACSAAAGPALEGMNISCGMRAAPGAVEAAEIGSNGRIDWRTVGQLPPRGLCGSGLLDLVAALRSTGLVSERGRLSGPPGSGIVEESGRRSFCLHKSDDGSGRGIFLTQGDIRQVQVARSAVYTGICLLLSAAGADPGEVGQVIVSGAFGAYLRPGVLSELGFVPAAWGKQMEFAGNTALAGAAMALLDSHIRSDMEELACRIESIRLEECSAFESQFVRNMVLKPQLNNKK